MKQNFLLLFLLTTFQLTAQNMPQNSVKSISGHIGSGQNIVRDRVFSPLAYSGISFVIGVNYQKEKEKHLHRFSLATNLSRLSNNFGNEVVARQVDVSYAYFYKLKYKHFWVGGISKTQINYRKFISGIEIGAESQNADIFSTLNAGIRYDSDNKKWGKIIVEADIPVVGVAFMRKAYNPNTNPDLIWLGADENLTNTVLKSAEIISLGVLKNINLDISYFYPISKKTNFYAGCNFNIYQYKRLETNTNVFNTTLKVGFQFLLRRKISENTQEKSTENK